MMSMTRRKIWLPLGLAVIILYFGYSWTVHTSKAGYWPTTPIDEPTLTGGSSKGQNIASKVLDDEDYIWRKVPTKFPVQSMRPLPTGQPMALPKIQAKFGKELAKDRVIRLQRQEAVKKVFKHCWEAYGQHAWLQDEVAPVSGESKNTFGGWGATLVDSLDTLWIMGLGQEFEQAASAASNISFETSALSEINVFETTIRYLGGFLAAYDLSGDQRLLRKAREVGDMLYVAFDTPNRMPITRWDFNNALAGGKQEAPEWALLAEIGSLCMEFTRLSLITGNPKWFDATERIMLELQSQQQKTLLPGMWPISIRPRDMRFTDDNTFALGAMADSVFEYLPKMVALSGGLLPHYEEMYKSAMTTAIKHNLYRPMTPDSADILIAGVIHHSDREPNFVPALEHSGQHLVCYVGGMLAVGGKLLDIPEHLTIARRLTDGCIWTYNAMPMGIMPETFYMVPCQSETNCPWDEKRWKQAVVEKALGPEGKPERADSIISEGRLPKGFTDIPERKYILRPEAIESVFILYRTTGDPKLLESAWAMFEAIQEHTATELANAAVADVTVSKNPQHTDSMESFWMGETLKYFYLIFSEPNFVSLDDFVFNTEAHPLRRLVP
jgi:mannosyl-oligosaccharide alpha-1,2-mannosidase